MKKAKIDKAESQQRVVDHSSWAAFQNASPELAQEYLELVLLLRDLEVLRLAAEQRLFELNGAAVTFRNRQVTTEAIVSLSNHEEPGSFIRGVIASLVDEHEFDNIDSAKLDALGQVFDILHVPVPESVSR